MRDISRLFIIGAVCIILGKNISFLQAEAVFNTKDEDSILKFFFQYLENNLETDELLDFLQKIDSSSFDKELSDLFLEPLPHEIEAKKLEALENFTRFQKSPQLALECAQGYGHNNERFMWILEAFEYAGPDEYARLVEEVNKIFIKSQFTLFENILELDDARIDALTQLNIVEISLNKIKPSSKLFKTLKRFAHQSKFLKIIRIGPYDSSSKFQDLFGKDQVADIVNIINHSNSLQKLSITYQAFTDIELKIILEAIRGKENIKSLNLAFNYISPEMHIYVKEFKKSLNRPFDCYIWFQRLKT